MNGHGRRNVTVTPNAVLSLVTNHLSQHASFGKARNAKLKVDGREIEGSVFAVQEGRELDLKDETRAAFYIFVSHDGTKLHPAQGVPTALVALLTSPAVSEIVGELVKDLASPLDILSKASDLAAKASSIQLTGFFLKDVLEFLREIYPRQEEVEMDMKWVKAEVEPEGLRPKEMEGLLIEMSVAGRKSVFFVSPANAMGKVTLFKVQRPGQ